MASAQNALVISSRLELWEAYAADLWNAAKVGGRNAAAFSCGSKARPYLAAGQSTGLTPVTNGLQYWPVTGQVAPNGFPPWAPWFMYEADDTSKVAPIGAVTALFADPEVSDTSAAAGAYGPSFYDAVFEMDTELECTNDKASFVTDDDAFYGAGD